VIKVQTEAVFTLSTDVRL